MHFDDNGIRVVAELKVLQYRRMHMNSTHSSDNMASYDSKLRLVEVATVTKNDSLIFLNGDKDNIWPGKQKLYYSYAESE